MGLVGSRQSGRLPLPLVLGIGLLGVAILAALGVALVMALINIRPFGAGTGGALQELKLVEKQVTVYLTFYTPTVNQISGDCNFATGQHLLYRDKNSSQTIDTCTASEEEKDRARRDPNYEVATQFNDNEVGRGALATNLIPNTAYPLRASRSVAAGLTYWLDFPNLERDIPGVPVVDRYGPDGRRWNNERHGQIGSDGQAFDSRHALDFAVKDNDDLQYWQGKLCTRNLTVKNRTGESKSYCAVDGVDVYYGNPFITPAGGPGTTGDGLQRTPSGFPRFLQYAGPWANQDYSHPEHPEATVSSSGCGPSSLANVALYYLEKQRIQLSDQYQQEFGQTVNPGTVATLSKRHGHRVGAGTAYGMFDDLGWRYFNLRGENASWTAVVSALRRQTPVISSMGPGLFTNGGHFVTLTGIDETNGKVFVSDSYKKNITEAPLAAARDQAKVFIIMTPL